MIASSSAHDDSGHRRTWAVVASMRERVSRHAVEERVLLALELADRAPQRVAVPALRVGVAADLVRLGLRQGRLGDERAEAGVFGLRFEERELLVGDRELGRSRLSRSLTSIRRRWSRVRDMGARVYDETRGVAASSVPDGRSSPHAIFSAEHEELRAASAGSSTPRCARTSTSGRPPGASPTRCSGGAASSGSSGCTTPSQWGGSDGDLAAGIVFVEELARCGCGGDPDGDLGADRHGDARARRVRDRRRSASAGSRPAIAGEKIGAIAITEPDAGSDVAAIRTRAERDGDVWRVNGREDVHHQRHARALPHAGRARPNPARAIAASRCSSSTRRCPGVSVSRQLEKLGMRASATPRRSRSTTSRCRTTT